LDEYKTFNSAFVSLYYASFGNFSFDVVGRSMHGPYFGDGYMIIFLISNIAIIMNMFISIINVMWGEFAKN
jgi:hypothetical protein